MTPEHLVIMLVLALSVSLISVYAIYRTRRTVERANLERQRRYEVTYNRRSRIDD